MSFLKKWSQEHPRLTSTLSSLICVGIAVERARSFAQSNQPAIDIPTTNVVPNQTPSKEERIDLGVPNRLDESTIRGNDKVDYIETGRFAGDSNKNPTQETLEETALKKYKSVTTRQEACRTFEGKIVTYYDISSLVQGCRQHAIEDAEMLNELVHSSHVKIEEIPVNVYRMIPFGKPFVRGDLKGNKQLSSKKMSQAGCEALNKKYVTVSGNVYYFVENCKKRKFVSYFELQEHNVNKLPIETLTPEQEQLIPLGTVMHVKDNEEAKLMSKMDGDVRWSKLFQGQNDLKPDTPESMNEIQRKGNLAVNKVELCKKIERKIVSFYSQIFFIDNCSRRQISDFSIALQQRAEQFGGVMDLTPAQLKSLTLGKAINADEVLKRMK